MTTPKFELFDKVSWYGSQGIVVGQCAPGKWLVFFSDPAPSKKLEVYESELSKLEAV